MQILGIGHLSPPQATVTLTICLAMISYTRHDKQAQPIRHLRTAYIAMQAMDVGLKLNNGNPLQQGLCLNKKKV
jgi:hypothetical protein